MRKKKRIGKKVLIAAVVLMAAALVYLGYRFYMAVKAIDNLESNQIHEQQQINGEPIASIPMQSTEDDKVLLETASIDTQPTSKDNIGGGGQSNPAATSSIDLGHLTIKGKRIRVLDSISETMLKKAPCWVETSALPGGEGMCLIYGHRNRTHLRVLKDVVVGDDILFTYQDGRTVGYSVSEIVIYEKTEDWTYPVIDGDTMVLVTCWPFVYSGSAPGKAVVISQKSAPAETPESAWKL